MRALSRHLVALAATAAGAACLPAAAAAAAEFAPGEVVVRFAGSPLPVEVELPESVGVVAAAEALERSAGVAYATPNYIATASAYPAFPRDPGVRPGMRGPAGGWVRRQWNFLSCGSFCTPGTAALEWQSRGGIDAPEAWRNLIAAGHPGGEGVTVAVLDSGIAYRNLRPRFRRSPDFRRGQFVPGYDFVQDDSLPLDIFGHGTHVAGTIAEHTNDRIAVTGLAYRAKLMPVRVLDAIGEGESDDISRGIRFAARHGADVINMSFNFPCSAPSEELAPVSEALRLARDAGAILVAAVGNWDGPGDPDGERSCIQMPGSSPDVIAVGGTTAGACLGSYSRTGSPSWQEGPRVDLVAPGGGFPDHGCEHPRSRSIIQLAFRSGNPTRFGLLRGYEGTSMAAAHVSGLAALVLASGVLGADPPPAKLEAHLRQTARDLGTRGDDPSFGAGLIDAGAATAPRLPIAG